MNLGFCLFLSFIGNSFVVDEVSFIYFPILVVKFRFI